MESIKLTNVHSLQLINSITGEALFKIEDIPEKLELQIEYFAPTDKNQTTLFEEEE